MYSEPVVGGRLSVSSKIRKQEPPKIFDLRKYFRLIDQTDELFQLSTYFWRWWEQQTASGDESDSCPKASKAPSILLSRFMNTLKHQSLLLPANLPDISLPVKAWKPIIAEVRFRLFSKLFTNRLNCDISPQISPPCEKTRSSWQPLIHLNQQNEDIGVW